MPKNSRHDSNHPPGEEPTVIVEISFSEKYLPLLYSKHVQIGIYVVALLALVAAGSAWYLNTQLDAQKQTSRPAKAVTQPKDIVVTVVTMPPSATILIDGKTMEQNPVVLNLTADSAHHTIIARAPGHEPLERDIRFKQTQTIRLELSEIIQPDGTDPGAPAAFGATGEIKEVITD